MKINLLTADEIFAVFFVVSQDNFSYYLYDGWNHLSTPQIVTLRMDYG